MATISTSTALYNKYRPQRFEDVVGQEVPVRTLTNALETGKVSNAYLLSGLHGTGKTSLARIFAKALLCDDDRREGVDACGKCSSCRAFDISSLPDYIEEDAASNRGIDNIRSLIGQLSLSPQVSRRKVVLIDEVHHLTSDAATSLLKKLEEPPAGVVFLLVTTDPMRLPSTIRSRCQWLRFKPIPDGEISDRLSRIARSEGVVMEPGVCDMVARSGEGSMRDAVSNLSQVVAFAGNRPVTEEDVSKCLGITSDEKVRALAHALAEDDLAAALTMEFPDDQGGAKGALAGLLSLLYEALLPAGGEPAETPHEMVVESLRLRGASWVVHARDVIERCFWKLDNPSFPNEHVLGEMATMIVIPETDPHCCNALANLPTPEVTVVQGDGDGGTTQRILKGTIQLYRMLDTLSGVVSGLAERVEVLYTQNQEGARPVDGEGTAGAGDAATQGIDPAVLAGIDEKVADMARKSETQGKALRTIIDLLRDGAGAKRGGRRKPAAKAGGEAAAKAGDEPVAKAGGEDGPTYRQPAF